MNNFINMHIIVYFIVQISVCYGLRPVEDFIQSIEAGESIIVIFTYFNLLLSTTMRFVAKLSGIQMSYQITTFLFTVTFGYLSRVYEMPPMVSVKELQTLAVDYSEYALPIVVLKVSLFMDYRLFIRNLVSLLSIILLSLIISLCAFAPLKQYLLHKNFDNMQYQLAIVLTLYPIFPVEVITRLKAVGSKVKHMTTLLEGEMIITLCLLSFLSQVLVILADHDMKIGDCGEVIAFYIMYILSIGIITGCSFGLLGIILLRKFAENTMNALMLTFAYPLTMYFVIRQKFRASSVLPMVLIGMSLNYEKNRLPLEVDLFLYHFWEMVTQIIMTVMTSIIGTLVGIYAAENLNQEQVTSILTEYLCCQIVRFGVYLIFGLFIARGKKFPWPHIIILSTAGIRDMNTLAAACIMFSMFGRSFGEHQSYDQLCLQIGAVCLMNLVINVPLVQILLYVLEITALSPSKQHNMRNCIAFLLENRNRLIAMLKMDRLLSEANWTVIEKITTIKNPYKEAGDKFVTKKRDTDIIFNKNICPDCFSEVVDQATQKELEDLRVEARKRILKARRLAYTKSYEMGLVNKESFAFLNQLLEGSHDSKELVMNTEEILKLFNRQNFFFQKIRNFLAASIFSKDDVANIPKGALKKKCHFLSLSPRFNAFIYIVVIFSLIWCVAELSIPPEHATFIVILPFHTVNTVILIIFVFEFCIKVYGFAFLSIWDGFKHYFSTWWNRIDFIVILVCLVDVYSFFRLLHKQEPDKSETRKIQAVGKILRLLRLLRVLKMLKATFPRLIQFCEMRIDSQLANAYDVGKCFVKGEEEILEKLPQMLTYKEVRDEMRHLVNDGRLAVTKCLAIVQRERPWISVKVKTHQILCAIHKSLEVGIEEFRSSGWIDTTEHKKLQERIRERENYVSKLSYIHICEPRTIFNEVIWMVLEQRIMKYLYDNAATKIFDTGDVIFEEDSQCDGIYILVTGLFKSTYVPRKPYLDDLKNYGILPVVDYITLPNFEDFNVEYILSGNSIGELACISKRSYKCTVVAESPSQAYIIKQNVLEAAWEMDNDPVNGLYCKMWKYVGIRIALSILSTIPSYSSLTQQKLLSVVEKSFVPNLFNFKVFSNSALIQDIVLLEGVVIDYNTQEKYVAPCYIPRTAQKLILSKSSQSKIDRTLDTKLLIIPTKDVDEYDVILLAEEFSELTGDALGKRTYNRLQKQKRKKRKINLNSLLCSSEMSNRKDRQSQAASSKSLTTGSSLSKSSNVSSNSNGSRVEVHSSTKDTQSVKRRQSVNHTQQSNEDLKRALMGKRASQAHPRSISLSVSETTKKSGNASVPSGKSAKTLPEDLRQALRTVKKVNKVEQDKRQSVTISLSKNIPVAEPEPAPRERGLSRLSTFSTLSTEISAFQLPSISVKPPPTTLTLDEIRDIAAKLKRGPTVSSKLEANSEGSGPQAKSPIDQMLKPRASHFSTTKDEVENINIRNFPEVTARASKMSKKSTTASDLELDDNKEKEVKLDDFDDEEEMPPDKDRGASK